MKKVIKTITLADREIEEFHKIMIEAGSIHTNLGRMISAMLKTLTEETNANWDSVARRAGYESSLAMHRAGCHPRLDWPRGVLEVVENDDSERSEGE